MRIQSVNCRTVTYRYITPWIGGRAVTLSIRRMCGERSGLKRQHLRATRYWSAQPADLRGQRLLDTRPLHHAHSCLPGSSQGLVHQASGSSAEPGPVCGAETWIFLSTRDRPIEAERIRLKWLLCPVDVPQPDRKTRWITAVIGVPRSDVRASSLPVIAGCVRHVQRL